MKTNIIKNEYDVPKKLPKPIEAGEFTLDFAYSPDAKEVDAGIREAVRGVKLSIMTMGIALCFPGPISRLFRQARLFIASVRV